MPVLKTCCGCPLETGSKILGFVNLVIDTLASSYGLMDVIREAREAVTPKEWKGVLEELTVQLYTLMEVFLGLYLLYGIYMRKLHFVRAWVVIQIVFLVVSVFSDVILTLVQFYILKTEIALLMPLYMFITGLHIFSILVVHSYEKSMRGSQSLHPI